MTFRRQIEPSIKSYECFMVLQISHWKSHWTDGFLKDLNRFFFQKPWESKNALYYQKNLQKVSIFVEKLKKMQWTSHWTDGFSKDLNRFFFENRKRVKMHSIIKKTYDFIVKLIKNSKFLLKSQKNATSTNDL